MGHSQPAKLYLGLITLPVSLGFLHSRDFDGRFADQ